MEESAGDSNLNRGGYPNPQLPNSDKAMGLLLQGKVKSTILNSGTFIDIDVFPGGSWETYPAALWGNYSYLPEVGFLAGVAGMYYAHLFGDWEPEDNVIVNNGDTRIWYTTNGYYAWFEQGDTLSAPVFAGIIFANKEDYRGTIGKKKAEITEFTDDGQYCVDYQAEKIYITLPNNQDVSPNNANTYGNLQDKKTVGFIYPWALRPILENSSSSNYYDTYNYGGCLGIDDTWDNCEFLDYYGATTSESWFDGDDPDWQPTIKSRALTHNVDSNIGEVFGSTPYIADNDTYPILAHSNFSSTWPYIVNTETGIKEPYWPGWWAENYIDTLAGCAGTKKDPNCWEEDYGRFISDSDVFMQFDDRWAHMANKVNTENEYETKGYPLGLKVQATAHSYGVAFAEDIMFVTVIVRNESGDWFDEDGNFHEGMIMPDGTKLNGGYGFNYRDISLGFYFDADVVTQDITGNSNVHTNADDGMSYLDTIVTVNNEELIISMATIYDVDGESTINATDLGIVAVQLLDSPIATDTIWKGPGGEDIFRLPGQKLKQTDWHWFDWYTRPGLETPYPSYTPADGKEEIMYKIMVGDTTNLTADQKQWYFHTANPHSDSELELDPHFDSLEGLEDEDAWDGGLDCVLISSCGPFSLAVGEEVPFSFTILFGEDSDDLYNNAVFAQIMYNSHYQGYTPPEKPTLYAAVDHQKVVLHWDDIAESSKDVITSYVDFEGYKVYKSTDGGVTWGDPEDKVYNSAGHHVGWEPIAQFDLTEDEDKEHCIYTNDVCTGDDARGIDISGPDQSAPWFSLGENTGLKHVFVDTAKSSCPRCGVIDGVEYTYAVTAYDTGIEADYIIDWFSETPDTSWIDEACTDLSECAYYLSYFPDTTWSSSNPGHWSSPDGYTSIEGSKGTTTLDANFVTVLPGYTSSNISFPGELVTNDLMVPGEENMGTGSRYFEIINYGDLDDNLYKFEIDAAFKQTVYNGNAVGDPELYVYQIDNIVNQAAVCCNYNVNEFSESSLAVLLGLPGVYLTTLNGGFEYCSGGNYETQGECESNGVCSSELLVIQEECEENDFEWTSYEWINDPSGGSTIVIPDYAIEGFELYSIDQAGYADQWTPFTSGLRFRFNNIPANAPFDEDLIPTAGDWESNAATDAFKAIDDLEWSVEDSTWTDAVTFLMGYKQISKYPNGFNFDYLLEFGTAIDTSVLNDCNDPDSNVDDDEFGVLLPFKIHNLDAGYCETLTGEEEDLIVLEELCCTDGGGTWEGGECFGGSLNVWHSSQKVSLRHFDNGLYDDSNAPGNEDCYWTRREWIHLYKEQIEINGEVGNLHTFSLFINIDFNKAFPGIDKLEWRHTAIYSEGEYVIYEGMLWLASENVDQGLTPHNPVEDNPWEIVYPWKEGDKVTIRTSKFFTDGDYWLVDFSQFGDSQSVTQEDLEKIRVVPNPYIVNSRFNETQFERRLRFARLPQECTITIYTITGEKVKTIKHNDSYDGNEWWNLRTINNQEVAPGLYIYTVEVGDDGDAGYIKLIGKFAVVR